MKPDWDRYYLYDDPIFRDLIIRCSKADTTAIAPLVKWLREMGDERAKWVENQASKPANYNDYYPEQNCLNALMTLGIYTCSLTCHCDWPNIKPLPNCKCCNGTGFQHNVQFPPGTDGFTVGWVPGLFPIHRDQELKTAMVDAKKIFREIYKCTQQP